MTLTLLTPFGMPVAVQTTNDSHSHNAMIIRSTFKMTDGCYKNVIFSGTLRFSTSCIADVLKECKYIKKFQFIEARDKRTPVMPSTFDIASILGSDVVIEEFSFYLDHDIPNCIPDDVFRGCAVAKHLSVLQLPHQPLYLSDIDRLCKVVTSNLNITQLEFVVHSFMYKAQFFYLVTHSNLKVLNIHDKYRSETPYQRNEDNFDILFFVDVINILKNAHTTHLVDFTYTVTKNAAHNQQHINLLDLFSLNPSIQTLHLNVVKCLYDFKGHDVNAVIDVIPNNTSLRSLTIHQIDMFDINSMIRIFHGLKDNTTLYKLELEGFGAKTFSVSPTMGDVIREVLLTNTTLTSVSLSLCRLTVSYDWLSDIISLNETLDTLKLPHDIEATGLRFFPPEFFKLLTHNKSIRNLYCLAFTHYRDNRDYLDAFIHVLKTNQALRYIEAFSSNKNMIERHISLPRNFMREMMKNNIKRGKSLYELLFPHIEGYYIPPPGTTFNKRQRI